jgi:hypothetical protein
MLNNINKYYASKHEYKIAPNKPLADKTLSRHMKHPTICISIINSCISIPNLLMHPI